MMELKPVSEAPPFWFKKPGAAAWALYPAGLIYGGLTAKRMRQSAKAHSRHPVLCIGNFIAGGAGKTPTAIAIAAIARSMGLKPGFLSRGYGGSITAPTVVVPTSHNAKDVGDEPLILALHAPTVISADRPAGAELLEQQDIDFIIMDDGFQNPSLHKDCTLGVVDARRGLGNGFCMPAGPLRADLRTQLAQVTSLLIIGRSQAGTDVVRRAAKMAKPLLTANIVARQSEHWKGLKVLAFAGIADPEKFYTSLEAVGADVVETRNFHDHHPFSAEECVDLIDTARLNGLTLATTQKDAARLVRSGAEQAELRATAKVLHIEIEFENRKMVEVLIRDTIKRAADHRLALRNGNGL